MSSEEIQADTMELPVEAREGAILAGKYLVGPVLGTGAMGIVVEARHLLLKEDVAIKFLVAGRWDQTDAVQRFVQEAQAAVRIQSERVVRVLDVAVLESGAPYIVMERLRGMDLAKRLRTGGPVAVELAVDLVLQACEAISESHRIGIIHRDLKPANLFILEREGASPSLKVLDFGISKSTRLVSATVDVDGALESAQITQAQTMLGSPFYMSPEQMESARDVDARTDIWALGVTLFEMLTGGPPFTGNSLVQVYSKMTCPDDSGWRVALTRHPPGLGEVVAQCLEWDRERRYATVWELARALAPFGSKRASISLERIAMSPDLSESNPGVERVRPLKPRRPGDWHVGRNLLAAMLAGFVGSALFILGSRPRPAVDAASPGANAAPGIARASPALRPVSPATPATPASPPSPSATAAPTASLSRPASAPTTALPAATKPRAARPSASADTSAEAAPTIPAAVPPPSASPSSSSTPPPASFIPEAIRGLLEKRE